MKLLSITSFALVLSLLEIDSFVAAVEAKHSNVLRGGRTIQQQQQQELLTNKKTSLSNGQIKNDNIHRKTQSREGVNDESSITTTITVEDEEEMSSSSDQIDMHAQITAGEIMMGDIMEDIIEDIREDVREDYMEDYMESENQDEEGMMEIAEEMMSFEEEFYERKLEEEYEEEWEEMTMESYYNNNEEYDIDNAGEDQEAPSVITLEPEEEGQGNKFENNAMMYYDNEMIGELTDEDFDEMMGEMYYTTDISEDFVEDSYSTSEEEDVAFEMGETEGMGEMKEMGEMEEMEEMEEMGEMGEMGETGFFDEGIDEEDEVTMMTLEPAE